MTFGLLLIIGLAVGATTVLFGFGGGFVAVPVILVADLALGAHAARVSTATSALVMLVNALVATLSTRRAVLRPLTRRWSLFLLLGLGGCIGALLGRGAPDELIRWGFVLYIGATIADLLLRPGFFRPARTAESPGVREKAGVPTWLGAPIGVVASFLGVGGSVMTVPLMRRAGASMTTAAAFANPLTLAIVAPAFAVSILMQAGVPPAPGLVGSVDVVSALALLAGSIPVVILLRRRPPRIAEQVHAWTYVGLLLAAGTTVALA